MTFRTNRPAPVRDDPNNLVTTARDDALNLAVRVGVVGSFIVTVINFEIWRRAEGLASIFIAPPFLICVALIAVFLFVWANGSMVYKYRATIIIASLCLAGVVHLLGMGLGDVWTIFFVGAVVLAGMFFSTTLSLGITALGIAIGAAAAVLFNNGTLTPIMSAYIVPNAFLSSASYTLLIGLMLVFPQRHIWESQAFVITIAEKNRDLLETRAALERQTRQLEKASNELTEANTQLQASQNTLERRAQQLAAAAEIGRAATSTLDLSTLLSTSVNLIRERFGFYHASVFIVEPGSNFAEVRESTGEAGRKLKARRHRLEIGSKSLVGTATATHRPEISQDVRLQPNYYPNPDLPETRAEAVIPMLTGDTVVGALDVQSTASSAFSPDDIGILTTISDQLAVAVQNARLFDQTLRLARRERLVGEITTKIRAAGSVEGMVRTAITELRQALGSSHGAAQFYSADYNPAPPDLGGDGQKIA